MRNAINEVMRNAYLRDCEIGLKRWNKTIEKAGCDFRLKLPSSRFRRIVGSWAGHHTDPDGQVVSSAEWERRKGNPRGRDRDAEDGSGGSGGEEE